MAWTEANIELGDLTMHYTRTGGDKPVLVLAHGFSDSGMCWLPVVEQLEGQYDVILPDARGHGLSSRVSPGQNLDRAADLAALIRALKLEKPVVGGHSMGGITASRIGSDYPELARALILEDPAWFEPRPADEPPPALAGKPEDNPWYKQLESYASLTVDEVAAQCRVASPLWGEAELRPWAESKKNFDLNNFRARDISFGSDWKEIARRITVPTLLLTGEVAKGGIVSEALAQKAVEINPLIQVAPIAGVGHNIRRENFPAFMAAMREFLASI